MTSRFEEARQEEARTQRLAAQTEALKRWLEKNHPEISFGIALLKEFRENMLGAFFTADDADWEFALNMIDTRYLRQHVDTPQEKKADLIDSILELIASKDGGRDGKFSALRVNGEPSEVDKERTRLSYFSIPELQGRLGEVTRKQFWAGKPLHETKTFVADARADTRKYSGFPDLDKSVTASTIKNLSTFELKKLIRVYSVQQVNDRLSGRN
jgi:hypothetical protein